MGHSMGCAASLKGEKFSSSITDGEEFSWIRFIKKVQWKEKQFPLFPHLQGPVKIYRKFRRIPQSVAALKCYLTHV